MRILAPIFLILSLIGIHAQFTKRWTKSSLNNIATPVRINDHIVLLGWHDRHNLYIEPEPGSNIGPCKIRVPIEDGKIFNPTVEAKALGNGKIVISTEKLSPEFTNPSNLFIIINPVDCSAKTIDIPSDQGDLLYQRVSMVYRDSFDVLPNWQTGAKMRRYNDKGEQVKLDDLVEPKIDLSDPNTRVKTIKEDPSGGYLVAAPVNGVWTLNLLSPKLETEKQVNLGRISFVSFSTGFNNITVCYVNEVKKLICENLDEELNSRFKVQVAEVPNNFDRRNTWISNLPDGGIMILQQIRMPTQGKSRHETLYAQRIYKNGTISERWILVDNRESDLPPGAFVMDNGDFCVVDVKNNSPDYPDVIKTDVIATCTKTQS